MVELRALQTRCLECNTVLTVATAESRLQTKFGVSRIQTIAIALLALVIINSSAFAQSLLWIELFRSGAASFEQNNFAEAESRFREAVLEAEKQGFMDLRLAESLHRLSWSVFKQGRDNEAAQLAKRATTIAEGAAGTDRAMLVLATILRDSAIISRSQWHLKEAETSAERALALFKKDSKSYQNEVANLLVQVAVLKFDLSKFVESEDCFRQAIALFEKTYGKDHPYLVTAFHGLGILYNRQGKHREAEFFLQRALKIGNLFHVKPEFLAIIRCDLAGFYLDQNDFIRAEPLLHQSLPILEKTLGPNDPELAKGLDLIGSAYYFTINRRVEAEAAHLRALRIFENRFGPDHPFVAYVLRHLGSLYADQKRLAHVGHPVLGYLQRPGDESYLKTTS